MSVQSVGFQGPTLLRQYLNLRSGLEFGVLGCIVSFNFGLGCRCVFRTSFERGSSSRIGGLCFVLQTWGHCGDPDETFERFIQKPSLH